MNLLKSGVVAPCYNMKHKSKNFLFDYLLASLCIIFNPTIFHNLYTPLKNNQYNGRYTQLKYMSEVCLALWYDYELAFHYLQKAYF